MKESEELKVGRYGRTNLGNIIKFAWYVEDGVVCKNKVVLVDEMIKSSRPFYYFEKNEFIKKHSKNIIDMIEVGDYVNGLYVHGIYDNGLEVYQYGDCHEILYADEIKSICTKEQFANAEYRLEG